jgi:hypothetical protein
MHRSNHSPIQPFTDPTMHPCTHAPMHPCTDPTVHRSNHAHARIKPCNVGSLNGWVGGSLTGAHTQTRARAHTHAHTRARARTHTHTHTHTHVAPRAYFSSFVKISIWPDTRKDFCLFSGSRCPMYLRLDQTHEGKDDRSISRNITSQRKDDDPKQ